MRKALGPGHRSAFYKQGYITFDEIIPAEELVKLRTLDLKPNNPLLLKLIKKRQLAEICYELMDKAPLRIASLALTTEATVNEGDCALLIDLSTGQVTYTRLPSHAIEALDGLVIILTPRYLDAEKHPVVFRL